ncbi:small ribosomal subunit biogenesis GTPase RsgA [Hahella sp. SMD15-11]|uniref:Small ribosomal subunit biogenesis GTPase RsgA n=1 Tax=Thermohahella caldifontis TaxID=3142973 RepID=A0AB39V0F4_9GAMM
MSKRRLTRQQKWRIERIQKERAERAKRKDVLAETLDEAGELGPEQEGLLIAHFGRQVEVEPLPMQPDHPVYRCFVRANVDTLVTGDRVVWREDLSTPHTGVVVAREPRRSELCRPDAYGHLKPVAANIDQIVVVVAAEPEPFPLLIDRYLVAAEAAGIPATLVLNKADLLSADSHLPNLLAFYGGLGYPAILASTRTRDGLDALQAHLANKTSVLVGQSGVGKSSLIQALLPGETLRIGDLSGTTRKGRHTTTSARLFHIPTGGALVDSPGIRDFGLWHMDERTLEQGFVEFRPYLGQCRFRDCRHEQEPGCALREAVREGKISERRFQNFLHIRETLDDVTMRPSR